MIKIKWGRILILITLYSLYAYYKTSNFQCPELENRIYTEANYIELSVSVIILTILIIILIKKYKRIIKEKKDAKRND